MKKVSKICQILLAMAFVCVIVPGNACAEDFKFDPMAAYNAVNQRKAALDFRANIAKASSDFNPAASNKKAQDAEFNNFIKSVSPASTTAVKTAQKSDTTPQKTEKKDSTPDTGVSTNTPAPQAQVTGCSSDLGLFSGLITTGREIFKGLRDLIYVVAGFGIIGVAVGGFFGNLNWKWLGAIIIGLVVIATTGELINTITGCEGFTTDMITDTLK